MEINRRSRFIFADIALCEMRVCPSIRSYYRRYKATEKSKGFAGDVSSYVAHRNPSCRAYLCVDVRVCRGRSNVCRKNEERAGVISRETGGYAENTSDASTRFRSNRFSASFLYALRDPFPHIYISTRTSRRSLPLLK